MKDQFLFFFFFFCHCFFILVIFILANIEWYFSVPASNKFRYLYWRIEDRGCASVASWSSFLIPWDWMNFLGSSGPSGKSSFWKNASNRSNIQLHRLGRTPQPPTHLQFRLMLNWYEYRGRNIFLFELLLLHKYYMIGCKEDILSLGQADQWTTSQLCCCQIHATG